MPAPRMRGVLPRRRREEDGEDESSVAGDLEEFSMSEGSAISNGEEDAEMEGSEASLEDEDNRLSTTGTKTPGPALGGVAASATEATSDAVMTSTSQVYSGALANGVEHVDASFTNEAKQNAIEEASGDIADPATSTPQSGQQLETSGEKSRREHLEYIRQRNSNPAFVPNRGGFFLHDDRSAISSSGYGRPFPRGRGRGYHTGYGVGRGYGQPHSGPADRPWAHDLHDTVNKNTGTPPPKNTPASFQIPTAKPAAVAPNRTFSVSTVLGNVTIHVLLPGMQSKKTFQNLVKKQHTLLPQHRPPLRRDKPVRISIPAVEPRYIFPSTERSFIFIPRAMRPNQQVYTRGRGRGSYQGSRRPSIMGSAYTPSVAMSRRSSIGGAGSNGISTPTDGTIPRGPMSQNFNRPVVRMPVAPIAMTGMPQPPMPMISTAVISGPPDINQGPTILHSPTVQLPMYQPRPQKTVSVAEIETPAVKAPQQQQQQPFHQQMPPGVSLGDGPAQQGQPQAALAMSTPLSHIPEGAVYAQPFQPYPMYPPGGYYGQAFPSGPMVYHGPADPYNMSMGGPVLAPHFTPGQNFVPTTQPSDSSMQQSAMIQDSNGMVYYYDPSQFSSDGSHMNQYPVTIGNGMVSVPGTAQYYYPAVPGGMYYPTTQ